MRSRGGGEPPRVTSLLYTLTVAGAHGLLVEAAHGSRLMFDAHARAPSRHAPAVCSLDSTASERRGLDALQDAVAKVRATAAEFGPLHEHSAIQWLDRSLVGGGTCTSNLRSALHDHDALMAECVLSDDGSMDPRCTSIAEALAAVQVTLDERNRSHPSLFPTDARAWVDEVLLDEDPTTDALRDQKVILFGTCALGEAGTPSDCEKLMDAVANYYLLVKDVQ